MLDRGSQGAISGDSYQHPLLLLTARNNLEVGGEMTVTLSFRFSGVKNIGF